MKRALVLSGGGSKGSYQIGVYKALKKMHIKIDIITGTSIGAINGALFTEKKYALAKRMWENITSEDLFGENLNDRDINTYKIFAKSFFKTGGLSNKTMEKYLREIINEKKIRNSKIEYGLVTYSYKNKKPLLLTKESIPRGELIDYIIASASCFPVLETKKINGDVLIDGGYYDNLPINLAIEMGADEIIAVDLNAVGFRKEHNNKLVKTSLIKCKDKSPFTISFTKEDAKKNIALGYNDTMKHYNQLDGENFTFRKKDLIKNYKNIKNYYVDLIETILESDKQNLISNKIFKMNNYNNIIKNDKEYFNIVNDSLEYLGDILDIDNTKIYNIDNYNKLMLKNIIKLNYLKINKKLKGKMLVGYIYNKYMAEQNKEKLLKELFNIALLFKKEFLATIYLISISEKYQK